MFCCVKGSDRKKQGKKETTWRIFSLKELQLATNNFNYDNKLGEGGFGSVYWGQLWDGSQIAVKRLKSWSNKAEVEFSVEVEILARVRHKNLLTLRGYCSEGQERLIVYDYMTNLSLTSHLHGQHSAECHLDWARRLEIAIGAAEGIAYLHHHATPHIIHRDIKASNILLDSDFKAQVADFGFARLVPDGATHVTTNIKGTLGYLAPEYAMLGKASEACDVYSFGILLLELVTGRKPLEKLGPSSHRRPITEWALPLARERKFDELADPKLSGMYSEEELKRVVLIGLVCAHSQPEKRPIMLEVMELLRGENKERFRVLESHEMFERGGESVEDIGVKEPKQEEEQENQEIVVKKLQYQKLPEHLVNLSVLKLDGSCFSVHIARNATVSMLKSAVEEEFCVSFKDENKKLWSVVWSHFCLCHNGRNIISDRACIQKYGIKDGDQLYFIQNMRIDLAPNTPKQFKNKRGQVKQCRRGIETHHRITTDVRNHCLKGLLSCSRFQRPKGNALEYYSRGLSYED
ncbi:protein kinase superfamily protein [Striga asiatica]|uniref:Protein kinase superfamily protein n=1 Tax=Striga asiatica TaxID=4170 RepID=A0A5A7QU62_STRAF|nr:protein kinase superfamily protein [Striga asiatica]